MIIIFCGKHMKATKIQKISLFLCVAISFVFIHHVLFALLHLLSGASLDRGSLLILIVTILGLFSATIALLMGMAFWLSKKNISIVLLVIAVSCLVFVVGRTNFEDNSQLFLLAIMLYRFLILSAGSVAILITVLNNKQLLNITLCIFVLFDFAGAVILLRGTPTLFLCTPNMIDVVYAGVPTGSALPPGVNAFSCKEQTFAGQYWIDTSYRLEWRKYQFGEKTESSLKKEYRTFMSVWGY
jgi:hypothetical protein